MIDKTQCKEITQKGTQCRNDAAEGEDYCGIHLNAQTPTPKQAKLLKLISDNLRVEGKTMTMYEMMLKAGYTEATARQQACILASDNMKEGLAPILNKMEEARDRAIKKLEEKEGDANYRDLVFALDKLTKNMQLLSDKPTSRHATDLGALLDEISNQNNDK